LNGSRAGLARGLVNWWADPGNGFGSSKTAGEAPGPPGAS